MTIYGGLFPDLAEKLAKRLDKKARKAAGKVLAAGPARDQRGTGTVTSLREKREKAL